MGEINPWEFECPQFVDFANLDGQTVDEDYFERKKNHISPLLFKQAEILNGIRALNENFEKKNDIKSFTAKKKIHTLPSESNNNKQKKAVSVSVKNKENVIPSFSSDQSSIISLNSKSCILQSCSNKDTLKSRQYTKTQPTFKTPATVANKNKTYRKRSVSLPDIQINRKFNKPVPPKGNATRAITPVCLKRSIKNKNAKKIKSTEERELEKIAELQKELTKHLRINNATMQKIGYRTANCQGQKRKPMKE